MSYQQITINVNDAVAESLADALMEHGALSAAIEDAYAGTENEQAIFGEPGMPTEQIWQQSKVIALFGESDAAASIIEAAAQECGLNDLKYTGEILEDQDWVRLTQAQFDPIQISDRLWITPSWHEAPNSDAVNLQLDPGLAFGTGSHPTTRLCLKWLDTQLKGGESVLDYGCGSGILAIAALKLGAGSAIGVDIDEQAIRASKDNAAQNNVDAQFYLPDACRKANLMSCRQHSGQSPAYAGRNACRTYQTRRPHCLVRSFGRTSRRTQRHLQPMVRHRACRNRRRLGAIERRQTLKLFSDIKAV